jgi:hypothetical protein
MGETMGVRDPRLTRVSHPYHAANRSHSSAHTPRRQTSHRAEPPPGRHPPPRTASHRGTGGWWSRPHQSEHRGARVEGPLMPYPVRCPWPLPAHTQTILVVRISRPLDALDFVNRISKEVQLPTDYPQTTEHSVEQLPVVAHGRAKPMVRPVRAP